MLTPIYDIVPCCPSRATMAKSYTQRQDILGQSCFVNLRTTCRLGGRSDGATRLVSIRRRLEQRHSRLHQNLPTATYIPSNAANDNRYHAREVLGLRLICVPHTPQTVIRGGGDCSIDEVGPYDVETLESSRRCWQVGCQEEKRATALYNVSVIYVDHLG